MQAAARSGAPAISLELCNYLNCDRTEDLIPCCYCEIIKHCCQEHARKDWTRHRPACDLLRKVREGTYVPPLFQVTVGKINYSDRFKIHIYTTLSLFETIDYMVIDEPVFAKLESMHIAKRNCDILERKPFYMYITYKEVVNTFFIGVLTSEAEVIAMKAHTLIQALPHTGKASLS